MTADTMGGLWTYSVDLARSLEPHGVSVSLATMGRPATAQQRRDLRAVRGADLHESPYKLEWMPDPWEDVEAAGQWLLELEQRLEPDVVHLNNFAHGALAWRAPAVVVGHSCVLSWWAAAKRTVLPSDWARYAAEVRRGLQAAGLVVAPSAAMLDELERYYGPLPRRRVVYNGRSAGCFQPLTKTPLVLTVARLWDEAKNMALLDQVAAALPWRVAAAGDNRHPDGHLVQAKNIELLGQLDPPTLGLWLGRTAIYALPARYEPFGLSAVEAALAGCALVLGDIPSLREVWGDTALFVGPDDARALRAAIELLIENPQRRKSYAARARQRALRLTPERMAGGYLRAYAELLKEDDAACAS